MSRRVKDQSLDSKAVAERRSPGQEKRSRPPARYRKFVQEASQLVEYQADAVALEFADQVNCSMEEQGITRAELARRIGTTPAYVTQVLRGDVNFTLATMVKLADAVGADLAMRLIQRMRSESDGDTPTSAAIP